MTIQQNPPTLLEEIKAITQSIIELREAQSKSAEELKRSQAETSAQMKRNEEQARRNEEIAAKSTEDLKQTIKRNEEKLTQLGILSNQTTEDLKQTIKRNEEKLARIGITFGNFQNNVGEEKEEMFYQYLSKNKKLNNIKFDEVNKNLNDGKREYDIVMKNGKYIAIIEVKQKAHVNDIDKLITEQVQSFKDIFTGLVDNKKIILAIASPVITPAVRKAAHSKGVAILTQNGDSVQEETVGEVVGF